MNDVTTMKKKIKVPEVMNHIFKAISTSSFSFEIHMNLIQFLFKDVVRCSPQLGRISPDPR